MTEKIPGCLLIITLMTCALFSCKKERSCENCTENNKLPVAIAGRDTAIALPLDSVLLDGRNSYDPDGSITKYLWTNISGPFSLMINPQFPACKIKTLAKGVYRFELTVTDNGGLSAKDTVMITVDSVFVTNHPPIAIAGADQTITLPTNTVSLDGSTSSDPDNNISSYQWTKISGPLSFSINQSNVARTQVTNFEQGVYEFELKITDAGGLVSKDTIRVTVFPATAREIIFTNQVLINLCYQPDVPGACWINSDSPSYGITISDSANVLPDSSTGISGVWIKMDTSSVWEQVPFNCWQFPAPYPQSNFTYCLTPDILSVWSWFFSFENLAGRKADVKISF